MVSSEQVGPLLESLMAWDFTSSLLGALDWMTGIIIHLNRFFALPVPKTYPSSH